MRMEIDQKEKIILKGQNRNETASLNVRIDLLYFSGEPEVPEENSA